MLETLVTVVMLISLILYALMGNADYGGGMWGEAPPQKRFFAR
jgi:hypothetical protein